MNIGQVLGSFWDFAAYTVIPFVLVLGFMIFFHELGHFLAARAIGVRVLIFKIGFGRWIWKTKRGHTEYGVAWFPIGGYVKMFGDPTEIEGGDADTPLDEIPEADRAETLFFRPAHHKLLVFFAGPLMNVIFAFLVAPLVFLIGINEPKIQLAVENVESGSPAAVSGILPGDQILSIDGKKIPNYYEFIKMEALNPGQTLVYELDREGRRKEIPVQLRRRESDLPIGESGIELYAAYAEIKAVRADSAAEAAGIQPGDLILKVNGKRASFLDLSEAVNGPRAVGALGGVPFSEVCRSSSQGCERELKLLVQREGTPLALSVRPRYQPENAHYLLGIEYLPEMELIKLGWWDSIKRGSKLCVESVKEVYLILWKLVSFQLSPKLMAGPLGIGAITSQAAHMGFPSLLKLVVLISINLGLLNLLPFPPLDGGHIVITSLEAVFKREMNLKVKEGVFWAGFMLLITLMVLVTLNDFMRHKSGMWGFFKGIAEGLGLH